MNKPDSQFPPDIRPCWNALAGSGVGAEQLQAFEQYLFGKDSKATPEQAESFAQLMKQLPHNTADGKVVGEYLFDDLYKKYHYHKAERANIEVIARALLEARHAESARFLAENVLGTENNSIPAMVEKALLDAAHEVLVKPREQVKLTEQVMKTTLRRHMLHEIDARKRGVDSEAAYQAPIRVLQPKRGDTQEVPAVEKVVREPVLKPVSRKTVSPKVNGHAHAPVLKRADSNGLLSKVTDAGAATSGYSTADKPVVKVVPAKPEEQARPSFGLRITSDGRSYYSSDITHIIKRSENPIPVTDAEKAEHAKKLAEEAKRAAREASIAEHGGWVGYLVHSLRKSTGIGHGEKLEKQRSNPNTDGMVRGK